jgi:hypothetical protein
MTDKKDGRTVGRSDEKDGQTVGRTDGQELPLPEAMQALAKTYHEPPPVPRDEIWARIQAARSDRLTIRPSDRPSDRPTARSSSRWLRFATGIAALLAVGIGIGRWSLGGNAAPETAPVSVAADAPRRNVALSLTAASHLGRAEAFLTAVRVGERGEGFESQARDLLLTTRFLLDARGITDPRTRALLEDLELVLVQIAQLGGRDGEEIDLLNDALEQKEVLPRLRKDL